MHLRRALLLFAVVLGLAALAAAVSRPTDVRDEGASTKAPAQTRTVPTLRDGTAGSAPEVVAFDAGDPRARGVQAGRPATVTVEVESAGMVSIPGLGVSAAAEPVTPARFDLLVAEPGRYPIDFAPAAGDEARPAGTLVVKPGET